MRTGRGEWRGVEWTSLAHGDTTPACCVTLKRRRRRKRRKIGDTETETESTESTESTETYCAPRPTNQTLPGWLSPPEKGGAHNGVITVPKYGIYLADMLMFSLLRARKKTSSGNSSSSSTSSRFIVYDESSVRGGALLNDYPPADEVPVFYSGGGDGGRGGANAGLERLDLRCYRWDRGWEGGQHFDAPKGVIIKNVASDLDDRKPVPRRYLDNEVGGTNIEEKKRKEKRTSVRVYEC